jgi:hypothetical protein
MYKSTCLLVVNKIQIVFQIINKKFVFTDKKISLDFLSVMFEKRSITTLGKSIVKKTKNLDILFIVRFFHSSLPTVFDGLETCISFLESDPILKDQPVIWNLPTYPLTEKAGEGFEETVDRLQERIQTSGDQILSQGYSGAVHSCLLFDELQDEFAWTFTDSTELSVSTSFLLPSDIDVFRSDFRGHYKQSSCSWIVAPTVSSFDPGVDYITILRGAKKVTIPAYFVPSTGDLSEKVTIRDLLRQQTPLIIIFELANGRASAALQHLSALFTKLHSRGTSIRSHTLDILELKIKQAQSHYSPIKETAQRRRYYQHIPYVDFPIPVIPHMPEDRFSRWYGFRKRFTVMEKKKDGSNQEVLLHLSGLKTPQENELPPTGTEHTQPEGRNFIANMTGTTLLNGEQQQIELEGGRFKNIIHDQTPLLCGKPASSYITADEKAVFEQLTSFSFENSTMRGLREVLTLENSFCEQEGKIVVDYLFIDNYGSLLISLYVSYPVLKKTPEVITSFAPFELALFAFNKHEAVRVHSYYPDGKYYTGYIEAHSDQYDLTGARFVFTHGERAFIIIFPSLEEVPIEVLPVKVIREGKQFVLFINPRGSYRPCLPRALSGIDEHFNIMVAADTGSHVEPDPIPNEVLSKLQPAWMARQRSGNNSPT